MMINNGQKENVVDVNAVYASLLETNRNVFVAKIDNIVFMYRPLGRKEYREIFESEQINALQKEEVICEICTLWPEHFDFEDCDAGIPTVLYQEIIKNSYLDSNKSLRELVNYYRNEMYDKENQITCIINEAFPQFDIEEIEEWDMDKTIKYLTRAEWKIVNFRGGSIIDDMFGLSEEEMPTEEDEAPQAPVKAPAQEPAPEDQSAPKKVETLAERQARLEKEGFFNKKQKLTPEKLAELKAKYPEMQFSQDVLSGTNDVGVGGTVDTSSPALRPGW